MMLSMIILLEIFFLQIYSEDTFDCTGYEDDSFHPMYNSNNCRYYWHCIYVDSVYMKAVKRVCPAGTEFDSRLNECEISSLVGIHFIYILLTNIANVLITFAYLHHQWSFSWIG